MNWLLKGETQGKENYTMQSYGCHSVCLCINSMAYQSDIHEAWPEKLALLPVSMSSVKVLHKTRAQGTVRSCPESRNGYIKPWLHNRTYPHGSVSASIPLLILACTGHVTSPTAPALPTRCAFEAQQAIHEKHTNTLPQLGIQRRCFLNSTITSKRIISHRPYMRIA